MHNLKKIFFKLSERTLNPEIWLPEKSHPYQWCDFKENLTDNKSTEHREHKKKKKKTTYRQEDGEGRC